MRSRLALVAVLCLALPLPAAAAQQRTPTPSADELWRSYPLAPSATPAASPHAAAPPARSKPATPSTRRSSTPVLPLAVVGVLIALGVLALPELRRRRSGAARPAPPPAPAPSRRHERLQALAPPDPHRGWTAVIEWHEADRRFRVLARHTAADPGAVLAESRPLPWPPGDPAAVQTLTEAAERLECALQASGWRALPPGREWYAKRFAWEAAGARRQARPRGRHPAHAR